MTVSFDFSSIRSKNALVTGGTSGIGRAITHSLTMLGANVLITGRKDEKMDEVLLDIKHHPGKSIGIVADQTIKKDIDAIFDAFDIEFGKLDILINNAAVAARSVNDLSYDELEYILKTNIFGYIYCTKLALSRMKAGASIINIGSLSSESLEEGASVYVATKSAIFGFSESIRKEINRNGVKLTLIEPGSVATDMIDETKEEASKLMRESLMLDPIDIANSAIFALIQPERSEIKKIQIKPVKQII